MNEQRFHETFKKEIAFATKWHEGQFRRDGVTPYVTHPIRVALQMWKDGYSGDYVRTALFHDLLEDTACPVDLLIQEFGKRVYVAVNYLSKVDGQDLFDYLDIVNGDPISRAVKTYDCADNLTDSPSKKQILKYTRCLIYLGTRKVYDIQNTKRAI